MPLLAFIESPLQALNLLEYSRRAGQPVDLAVVADRSELSQSNRSQIEAVLELVRPRNVIYHECRLWPQKPARSRNALKSAYADVNLNLAASEFEVVVGEFRSTFCWALIRLFSGRVRRIVVVDDGTAMLRIRRRHSLPRSRDDLRSVVKFGMLAVGNMRGAPPRSGLTFFTAFSLEGLLSRQDEVIHNDYRSIAADTLALPPDDESVYVIGSPHLEAGVVAGGDVELAVDLARYATSATGKTVVYMAHRRERPEKLLELGREFSVVTPNVPFEIYSSTIGKRPTVLYGYQSSLFATMAELIGDSLKIVSLEIPRHYLNPSWVQFVDDLYRYYREQLEGVVEVVAPPRTPPEKIHSGTS